MNKQLEVQIMGQSYLLGCPDGGQAKLLDAVERVDAAMCKIRDAGKIKARDRIAVLAALNLAFDVSEREAAASATPFSSSNFGSSGFGNAEPPSTATPTAASTPAPPSAADPRLGDLLSRLDAALVGDGQLL